MIKLALMKATLFYFIFSFICAPFAFSEPFPSDVSIIGRGIQNKSDERLLLLACVGSSSALMSGIRCDRLRFVLCPKNQTPAWMGNEFKSDNMALIANDLNHLYQSTFSVNFLGLFENTNPSAFTNQDGWGWAQKPTVVEDDEFKKLIMTSLYYAADLNVKAESVPQGFSRDFLPGDRVYAGMNLVDSYTVKKVLGDGWYLMTDGSRRSSKVLSRSVNSLQNVVVGQTALVSTDNLWHGEVDALSELKVLAITESGLVLVDVPAFHKTKVVQVGDIISLTPLPSAKVYTLKYAAWNTELVEGKIAGVNKKDGSLAISSEIDHYFYLRPEEVYYPVPAPADFKVNQVIHHQTHVDEYFGSIRSTPRSLNHRIVDFIQWKGEPAALLEDDADYIGSINSVVLLKDLRK